MIFYLVVILGVLASSASQLLLKKSASVEHRSAIYTLLNWRVILAYFVMAVVLVTNIYAMSKGVQLKDMPILEASGYIFVPLLTWLFLHERIDRRTLASIGLILAGIVVFYL